MEIDIKQILDYELHSSWWAPWISFGYLQQVVATYFAWKVRSKFAQYQNSKKWEDHFKKNPRKS